LLKKAFWGRFKVGFFSNYKQFFAILIFFADFG
jgi:hypothetical protein